MLPLSIAAALLAPAVAGSDVPQQDKAEHVTTVQRVSPTIHVIQRYGANMAVLIGEEGVLKVDGGFLDAAPEIEIALVGLTDLPVRYLVNTHWHEDHTQSNPYWAVGGAAIIAHESVRAHLLADESIPEVVRYREPMDAAGVPTITFRERLDLRFNGQDVRIWHYPAAHSDGDAVVYFPAEKVACVGDVYRQDNFPFIELISGGRPAGMLRAVEDLLRRLPQDTVIVPGHGAVSDMAGLREFYDMLFDANEQLKKAVREGVTVLGLYERRMLGEYEDRWSGGSGQRARGFLQIMWYTYAPKRTRGLGESTEPSIKPEF